MKQRFKKIVSAIGIVMFVLAGSTSGAVVVSQTSNAAGCDTGISIFPRWYDNLCTGNGDIKSPSSFAAGDSKTGGISKFVTIIALNIVNMLLYAVGYVSLGFIIWGGFKYMTAGDSSNGTAAAKSTILNAVIGMIIAIMAVAIVNFVTTKVAQ